MSLIVRRNFLILGLAGIITPKNVEIILVERAITFSK
jgi:hypothetical protein